MLKKISFFFSHATLPPSASSNVAKHAPDSTSGASAASNLDVDGREGTNNNLPPDAPVSNLTHPTALVQHHYGRFVAQSGQYNDLKKALRNHDKQLSAFVRDSASLSVALETLCEAAQGDDADHASEVIGALKSCRHALEKVRVALIADGAVRLCAYSYYFHMAGRGGQRKDKRATKLAATKREKIEKLTLPLASAFRPSMILLAWLPRPPLW